MTIAAIYVDPALVFVLGFVAILGGWSLLNRWEGEKLRRRLRAEARRRGKR